jgi:hypothetical protein
MAKVARTGKVVLARAIVTYYTGELVIVTYYDA